MIIFFLNYLRRLISKMRAALDSQLSTTRLSLESRLNSVSFELERMHKLLHIRPTTSEFQQVSSFYPTFYLCLCLSFYLSFYLCLYFCLYFSPIIYLMSTICFIIRLIMLSCKVLHFILCICIILYIYINVVSMLKFVLLLFPKIYKCIFHYPLNCLNEIFY